MSRPADADQVLTEVRANLSPMPEVTAELRVRLPAGEAVHISVAGPHRLVAHVLMSAADAVTEEIER